MLIILKLIYSLLQVDKILAEKGITVLRLPTKHCEYNPIELVRSFFEQYLLTPILVTRRGAIIAVAAY